MSNNYDCSCNMMLKRLNDDCSNKMAAVSVYKDTFTARKAESFNITCSMYFTPANSDPQRRNQRRFIYYEGRKTIRGKNILHV